MLLLFNAKAVVPLWGPVAQGSADSTAPTSPHGWPETCSTVIGFIDQVYHVPARRCGIFKPEYVHPSIGTVQKEHIPFLCALGLHQTVCACVCACVLGVVSAGVETERVLCPADPRLALCSVGPRGPSSSRGWRGQVINSARCAQGSAEQYWGWCPGRG